MVRTLSLISLLLSCVVASAQTGTDLTNYPAAFTLNGSELLYCVQAGVSDKCTASQIATFASNSIPLPGLASNVESSGSPGLDMGNCTTEATCGIFLYSAPTAYPAAAVPTLRVQRNAPASGGTLNDVYDAIEGLGYTGLNDPGSQWVGAFVLHNRTLGTAGAGSVAVNGTAFKELNGQAPGTQMGNTWASNFNCVDATAVVNPTASCAGSEIDINAYVGAGTDANLQRVGVQIAAGVANGTDTGVHIGRALLIGAQGGAVIDHAVELNDASNITHLLILGNGATTITSAQSNWSSSNFDPGLVVTTSGGTNPAIGLFDVNNSNGWAFGNNSGSLQFLAMPAVSDSKAAPTLQGSVNRTTGAWTFAGDVSTATHYLNTSAAPGYPPAEVAHRR